MAEKDPLTGAATLEEFLHAERDEDLRCRGGDVQNRYGIVLVGVVGLRALNQTHGFDAADAMLAELGSRIREWAGDEATLVGRVGGGDFAVLVGADAVGDLSMVARRLRRALTRTPLVVVSSVGETSVELSFCFRAGPNPKSHRSDLLWDCLSEARTEAIRELHRRVADVEARAGRLSVETGDLRARLQEAEMLARRDPLTGLLNQRGLQDAVATMSGPRVVAFVDVDNLRQLNGADKENWDGGDTALRGVADLLGSTPGAVAARWGGDEFTVIYPGATLDEAVGDLDQLRARCTREVHVGGIEVSFSAGLAFASGPSSHDEARRAALEAARHAKDTGRARVVAAQTPES